MLITDNKYYTIHELTNPGSTWARAQINKWVGLEGAIVGDQHSCDYRRGTSPDKIRVTETVAVSLPNSFDAYARFVMYQTRVANFVLASRSNNNSLYILKSEVFYGTKTIAALGASLRETYEHSHNKHHNDTW